MLTAIAFTIFNCMSYFLALKRAPFWGLLAYMNVYFNSPNPRLNWWAQYLPFDRWSLITSIILLASVAIHWNKTSNHNFASAKWIPWFIALSIIIASTNALNKEVAYHYVYLLFTYGLIVFIIVKSIVDFQQLRFFLLALIGFIGYLSFSAYLYGERVNGRLENFGSADANGANEFSLLIIGIMPFMFAFLRYGKTYEKLICLASLPFVINAFILCNSRGSTVALAGALILAALVIADGEIRKKLLIGIIVFLPAFVYLADDEFTERFTSLVGVSEAIDDATTARDFSSGRTEIWTYGLEMMNDNPLGAGPGGFSELARFYMPVDVLTFRQGTLYGGRSAHNTYLQVLVEQGVLGLVIWVGMCLQTCLILRRSFRMTSKLSKHALFWKSNVFALNVSFFSVLIAGMINSRIYYEFFWWQIAMSIVVYALLQKLTRKDSADNERIKQVDS